MASSKRSTNGFGRSGAPAPIASSLASTTPARYLTGDGASGRAEEKKPILDDRRTESDADAATAEEAERLAAEEATLKQAEAKIRDQQRGQSRSIEKLKDRVIGPVLDQIDVKAAAKLSREALLDALEPVVHSTTASMNIMLSSKELSRLHRMLLNEIAGFGPLEPLLEDPTINDILVNGPDQVYVERKGKLEEVDISFRDEEHVLRIANRICSQVGRRVDITTPMADARLPDGSRVNVIAPPLSLRGCSISIRKFGKFNLELDDLVDRGSLSHKMAKFLKLATLSRLNIVVSGGTGSGKTTMLNALSQYIDPQERIVTIEDAAELQLRQPHIVPLETRPKNLEGQGEVTIRDLLVNSLRMRPDRIILGEVRGKECFDMLQAFNTGHDGGLCTLHANSPRDALSRMENLLAIAQPNFPLSAMRKQIAETIDLIVQVKRMRDGVRRVTDIVEVVGLESDTITTQTLFEFVYKESEREHGISGEFEFSGFKPHCYRRISEAGLARQLQEILA